MLHIRWGLRRDLPEIMAIEAASFEYAWTEADFLRCLAQRNCISMVAESGGAILGFMVYELRKASIRLLNFAVHPGARREGVGSEMVAKLRYKLCSHRRERLFAVVREGNTAAQLFFRAQGFEAVRVHRGYYADSREDGYELEYTPTSAEWDQFGGAPVNRIATYEGY